MTIAKAIVAAIVALIGALVVGLEGDDTLTTVDWLVALVAVVGSGGVVWYSDNTAAAPYVKAVAGFVTGGATALIAALGDEIVTTQEALIALGAAIAAAGFVAVVPNRGEPSP